MSSPPIASKLSPEKQRKPKDKENQGIQPRGNERLKIIVRRLPPNLPEDIFWQSVGSWVSEESTTWRAYHIGKLRKKLNKENVPSRAYIAFKNEEILAKFSREYDGHLFRDKTGAEYIAIVEFAPYPKIPSEKRKPDPRNATIDKDEDYLSFLESLKAQETSEPPSLDSLIAAARPPSPPKTTPLLEALKAEKSANKDRDAILRNHAHYSHVNANSRKDDKKKAASLPRPSGKGPDTSSAPASKADAAASSSKKPSKKPAKEAAPSLPPPKILLPNKPTSTSQPIQSQSGQGQAAQSSKPARPPRGPKVKPPTAPVSQDKDKKAAEPSTPVSATADAGTSSADGAPKRSRPVLGLGRHFEAAISGATGGERRPRKERGPPTGQPSSSPLAPGAPSISASSSNGGEQKPQPLPSPKKDRPRRGRGPGGPGGNSGTPSTAAPAPPSSAPKIPTILQRIDDSPPPTVPPGLSTSGGLNIPSAISEAVPSGSSRGGSRDRGRGDGRGRGRGRGRGGGGGGGPASDSVKNNG